jgi:uncharacterized iron-regulated membrane protein
LLFLVLLAVTGGLYRIKNEINSWWYGELLYVEFVPR